MDEGNTYFGRLTKLLFYILIAAITYLALKQVGGLLFMLFVSLLAAYILSPLVDWFEARRVNRTLAVTFVLFVGLVGAVAFFFWIVPTLISEFKDAGTRLQIWLAEDHSDLAEWLSTTVGIELSAETVTDVKQKVREHAPQMLSHVGDFLKGAAAQTMSVVGWVLNIIMVPVFVFYFLRDFGHLKAWVAEHLPRQQRDFVVERAARVDAIIGQWLRGQVEVALILTVLYSVTLWIVGVKLGLAIGIIAGLMSVVPYLGFAFGLGLGLLMAILDWQGPGMLSAVFLSMLAIHLLEGYVLAPQIVGEKIGLSPMTILIALLLGGELFGLMGFILAVPVAGGGKVIAVEVMDWYKNSEYYTGETVIEVE